jgi:signal transduction histidine kinase
LAQSVDTHRPDAASRKRLALHGCRGVVTALLMMVAFAVPAWAQPVANPASPGPAGGATAAWRVVILNGADPTLPAFVAIDTALRAGLAAPGRHPVEVFAESLDMMRFPSNELEPEMLALLRKKYASRHVDAVIAVAGPAFDFALKYRDELWPNARIVFHSVPVMDLAGRALPPGVTGIPVRHDIAGTVAIARRLQPALRHLVIVAGSADYDHMLTALARKQLAGATAGLTVDYWPDRTLEEMLAGIARLSPHDAVVYLAVYRDRAGRTFIPREVLRQLAAVSPAPMYGPVETFLGVGIVAGSVDSFARRGAWVARTVHELLGSPSEAAVSVVEPAPPLCVADASRLEKFGLERERLPSGCSIQFEDPGLWKQYRWYVVVALAGLIGQTALILGLVMQRRARRRAEVEARSRRVELARASRLALAGELTASIAHEINQPLGAILANASAAQKLLEQPAVERDALRAIVADIRRDDLRASDVIRHVRSLVTNKKAQRDVVDVARLLAETASFIAVEARRRGIRITCTSDLDSQGVWADRTQLQQAIVNLCLNAMDAVADAPVARRKIELRARAHGERNVAITVTDYGPGIAPDLLPKLFDSFFTTRSHGLGLGLSITRAIVDAHGGRLTAENVLDGGATFAIVLPVANAAVAPGTEGIEEPL